MWLLQKNVFWRKVEKCKQVFQAKGEEACATASTPGLSCTPGGEVAAGGAPGALRETRGVGTKLRSSVGGAYFRYSACHNYTGGGPNVQKNIWRPPGSAENEIEQFRHMEMVDMVITKNWFYV